MYLFFYLFCLFYFPVVTDAIIICFSAHFVAPVSAAAPDSAPARIMAPGSALARTMAPEARTAGKEFRKTADKI